MGKSANKKCLYYIPRSEYKRYQVDITSTAQAKTATLLTTTAGRGSNDAGFSVAQFDPNINQIIASQSGQFLYLTDATNKRIRRIDLINKIVPLQVMAHTRLLIA